MGLMADSTPKPSGRSLPQSAQSARELRALRLGVGSRGQDFARSDGLPGAGFLLLSWVISKRYR
jgi:hypothetical protein